MTDACRMVPRPGGEMSEEEMKERYNTEWQALVENFLALIVTDPHGRVATHAQETLRRMMILKKRAAKLRGET